MADSNEQVSFDFDCRDHDELDERLIMKNILVGISRAAAKQATALNQKALRPYSWPLVAALAMTLTVSTTLLAQAQKAVSQGDTISKTFAIDAIDHTSRVVTLRDSKGDTEAIVCG